LPENIIATQSGFALIDAVNRSNAKLTIIEARATFLKQNTVFGTKKVASQNTRDETHGSDPKIATLL